MSTYIAGFICALILAAFVIAWIAYCMFVKERHKSEFYQHDVSDLQEKHYEIAQEQAAVEKPGRQGIAAGIFILPSLHKQPDDYEKRPDYPEGPLVNNQGSDQLIEIMNSCVADDSPSCNAGFEIDSGSAFCSDV